MFHQKKNRSGIIMEKMYYVKEKDVVFFTKALYKKVIRHNEPTNENEKMHAKNQS